MEKKYISRREYRVFSEAIWTFWLKSCNITVRTKEELAAEKARWYGHKKHQTKVFPSSTNKKKPSTESFENFNSFSSSFSPPKHQLTLYNLLHHQKLSSHYTHLYKINYKQKHNNNNNNNHLSCKILVKGFILLMKGIYFVGERNLFFW
jgi:hypothetical protein